MNLNWEFRVLSILGKRGVFCIHERSNSYPYSGGMINYFSELFQSDPTDETAQILFQVALSFQHLQADAEVDICNDNKLRELPELTLKLASQALTICSTGKIDSPRCYGTSKKK